MIHRKTLALHLMAAASLLSCSAWAATFKVAVGDAQGGTQWELATRFKQSFEQKTGGKHKLDLFPNGQLGSEEDTVNNAAMGTLDFSVLAVNNVTPFSPTVGVLSLPYVIQSAEEARKLTMGEIGKELTANTVRDANVRIVGWAYSGFRVLTNSKKPVRTVADLQGLKIRVPKNEIMIATYQAWGINPTPMAWGETFTAVQQGTIDGLELPLAFIDSLKVYEVTKYLSQTNHTYTTLELLISNRALAKLSPEQRKAVAEAGTQAVAQQRKTNYEHTQQMIGVLKGKGMQVNTISDPAAFRKAVAPVYEKFKPSIGADLLNAALEQVK